MNLSHMLGAIDDWWVVETGIIGEAINFIGFIFYAIFTGIGMLIDFVLSLFKKFAGIEPMTLTVSEKTITVGGENSWTDMSYAFITSEAVNTAFWTIFAMCIALLVIFTIFAIVKSEFTTDVKNAAKLPILERAVKSVINFLLIPVISFFSIYGANMLTKAVFYTFNESSSYCISNVVFNAGALSANRISQDDGFANYLLATETVYFANEQKVNARDQVVSMLSNYYSVPEGYVNKYKMTKTRISYSQVVSPSTLVESQVLSLTSNVTSTEGDSLGFYDNIYKNYRSYSIQGYEITYGHAGEIYIEPTTMEDPSDIGSSSDYYWYKIQMPVAVNYVDKDSGFEQVIYSLQLVQGKGSTKKTVTISAQDPLNTGLLVDGMRANILGKNNTQDVTVADITNWENASWWDSMDNSNIFANRDLKDSDKSLIAQTLTDYARTLRADTQKKAADKAIDLWDVLKKEYNTAEKTIFGTKPVSTSENSVQAITQDQRKLLAEFINKIFVGDGHGSSSYVKYAIFSGSGDDFTLEGKTEEKIKEDIAAGTLTENDYLKISSETLHVEPFFRKNWVEIVKKTNEWSVSFSPDYQQRFWAPTNFGGEAVMDIGLVGYFYKFNNMNLVMMLFGLVAIAWQYFKLILVFVKRALEMVLLFLMAPIVTAIAPLDKGNAENSWRSNWIKQLTMTAVPVFAINVFFTIVPLVTSITPFGDGANILNPLYNTYNAFVSIIFIYVGVSMINKASALLAGFLGTDDMIAQGKELTGKATGIATTAAKGAALVGGISLAGPAALIKRGFGTMEGARAAHKSKESSRAAAMADLEAQMDTARAEGDENREFDVKARYYNFDDYAKMSSKDRGKEIKRTQDARNRILDDIEKENQANAPNYAELEQLQAKQKELASRPMKMGRQKKWDAAAKAQWQQEQAEVASQIADKQQEIDLHNKEIEKKRKLARDYSDDIRFYSSFDQAKEDARDAFKKGITLTENGEKKVYTGYEAGRDKPLTERLKGRQEKIQGKYDDSVGKVIKRVPLVGSTVDGALNWAANKMLVGALGVVTQVADRKLASTPKNLADLVKGLDGTGGAFVEKVLDPGKLGKTISTEEENTARDAQKDEKARAKVWRENAEREKKKVQEEEKAMKKLQEEETIKQQLRDWETYKMGGFNIKGDKIDVNADRNETVAKNYKAVIDKRADMDFKNNLHKTDKDFEKFKKMLKDTQAESKKQAQNVKIDPSDKTMAEKIAQAMKKINSQQSRELKNVNAGISSLLDVMKKIEEKTK